jgi:4-hydroxy-tetrahydrodipicolinate reductase
MVHVIVSGAAGRMGARLVALLAQCESLTLVAAIEKQGHTAVGKDAGELAGCRANLVMIGDDLATCIDRGDVIIEFSSPQATLEHLRIAAPRGKPMVIGTTGFSPSEMDELRSLAQRIPCVYSPNMSVGVNLLFKVLGDMAKTLKEDYDFEVLEAHHRLKKDAPSGTALRLAEVLAQATGKDLAQVAVYTRKGVIGERKPGEIGIQAIRAGDIVGDHTVIFAGMDERIEITHRAHSRDTFARGALRAARWVVTQPPGLYSMLDVLGLK